MLTRVDTVTLKLTLPRAFTAEQVDLWSAELRPASALLLDITAMAPQPPDICSALQKLLKKPQRGAVVFANSLTRMQVARLVNEAERGTRWSFHATEDAAQAALKRDD